MDQTILISLTVDQLKLIIAETVKDELTQFQVSTQKQEKQYYTRKQTAERLHISLPTLNEKTKQGEIEGQRFGNRLLYSEEAIEKALKSTIVGRRGKAHEGL